MKRNLRCNKKEDLASNKDANIVPLTEGADRPHDEACGEEECGPWQQTRHFPGFVSSKGLSVSNLGEDGVVGFSYMF